MKIFLALSIFTSGLLSSCVQMVYTKEVQVRKNAAGQIVETIETETISEPHSEMKHFKPAPYNLQFNHMR